MRYAFAWTSVRVNARETALLSAASDSYITQPLSINNEEARSSTEEKKIEEEEVGGGETRPEGRVSK